MSKGVKEIQLRNNNFLLDKITVLSNAVVPFELFDAGLFFTRNFEMWVLDDTKDVSKRVCHRRYANAAADIIHIAMFLRAKFKHPLVCSCGILHAPISDCIITF